MQPVLSVINICKNYGKIEALKNVSFDVPVGSIFGILGPNGSGKTTLLGIVVDILKATSGSFLWNGEKPTNEQRKQIGTFLETPNFYHYLSAQKNLEIAAEIKGVNYSDIPRVLQIVNLTQRKDSKFSTFSLGMKQRLAIASALLGNPSTLLLDEPTNGLDPAGIAEIRELLKSLARDGKTIIMASHILDEVEKVCSHVAIIQKGDLKAVGTVVEILNTGNTSTEQEHNEIEIAADNMQNLQQFISKMQGVHSVILNENLLKLSCDNTLKASTINSYCMENGFALTHLSLKKKSLETKFLEITGNKSDR